MSKLLFILTGGTIDSFAEGYRGTAILEEEHKSFIPDYLASQKLYTDYQCVTVCMKDSPEINTSDLDKIMSLLAETDAKQVIITHGTDAMVDSAVYIQQALQRKDLTVVLTGSMLPLEAPFSDGGCNLGFAVAQAKALQAGVYIAMHGRCFAPENVIKNREQMRFQEA